MTEPEIPAEVVERAAQIICDHIYQRWETADSGDRRDATDMATAALHAANYASLLAERDALRRAANGFLNSTDTVNEARYKLEAALSEHQEGR